MSKSSNSVIQCQLKLRLRPAQERQLDRWLFRLTGAWNWAVRKIEQDARHGIYYSAYDMKALVRGHSSRVGVPADALTSIVANAQSAWDRCFSRLAKRPRLKGRRNRLNSIPFLAGREFRSASGRLKIPCIGQVRFHSQEIPNRYVQLVPHEDVYPTRACEGGNRVFDTWYQKWLPREMDGDEYETLRRTAPNTWAQL